MATRRSHKKSRTGCKNCKQRRIKCGEELPTCLNCFYSVLDCDLSTSPSQEKATTTDLNDSPLSNDISYIQPATADYTSPYGDTNTHRNQGSGSDDVSTFQPALSDIELIHQFATSTFASLGRTPEGQEVWKLYVPKLALSHAFLLHGILAFSALHLAHLNPSKRIYYRELAISHHQTGLHEFRSVLNDINESNFNAAFLFSTLLVVYNFALQATNISGAVTSADALDSIHDWFSLIRGVHVILNPFRERFQAGELAHIIRGRSSAAFVDGEHTVELRNMVSAFATSESGRDAMTANAYGHAVEELITVYAEIRATSPDSPPDLSAIMVWPIKLHPHFIAMLRMHTSEALVILAHYAIMLKYRDGMFYVVCSQADLVKPFVSGAATLAFNRYAKTPLTVTLLPADLWWLEGWGEYLISAVEMQLPHDWKHWLEWPRRKIETHNPIKPLSGVSWQHTTRAI